MDTRENRAVPPGIGSAYKLPVPCGRTSGESKSGNPTPDPINGFLVESRARSAMNVTTIVIERNCIVREGESSLIAEADMGEG